jgi:hypothetical protein
MKLASRPRPDTRRKSSPLRRNCRTSGGAKPAEHVDDERQRVEAEPDAQQEEERRRRDEGQGRTPLVAAQAGADEPPDLPEDDRRRHDGAGLRRGTQGWSGRAAFFPSTPRRSVAGPPPPRGGRDAGPLSTARDGTRRPRPGRGAGPGPRAGRPPRSPPPAPPGPRRGAPWPPPAPSAAGRPRARPRSLAEVIGPVRVAHPALAHRHQRRSLRQDAAQAEPRAGDHRSLDACAEAEEVTPAHDGPVGRRQPQLRPRRAEPRADRARVPATGTLAVLPRADRLASTPSNSLSCSWVRSRSSR